MSDQQNQPAAEAAPKQHLEADIVGDPAQAQPAPEAPPAETGEKSADEPAAQPQGDRVPTEVMVAERKRRQKAEQEAAYYRGLAEARQAPTQPQNQPSKEDIEREFYADPIGWTSNVANQAASNAVLRERQQRATVSERRARAALDDYDDVIGDFYRAVEADPSLREQLQVEPDPARWAYNYAKKLREKPGTIDEAAIEARVRKQIEEENRKKSALSAASQTPKTQASATGASPGVAPSDAKKDPLAGLFSF